MYVVDPHLTSLPTRRSSDLDIVQANAGDTLKYAVLSRLFFGWKARIVFRNASTISQYIRNPISRLYNRWLYRHTDYIDRKSTRLNSSHSQISCAVSCLKQKT